MLCTQTRNKTRGQFGAEITSNGNLLRACCKLGRYLKRSSLYLLVREVHSGGPIKVTSGVTDQASGRDRSIVVSLEAMQDRQYAVWTQLKHRPEAMAAIKVGGAIEVAGCVQDQAPVGARPIFSGKEVKDRVVAVFGDFEDGSEFTVPPTRVTPYRLPAASMARPPCGIEPSFRPRRCVRR